MAATYGEKNQNEEFMNIEKLQEKVTRMINFLLLNVPAENR